MSLTLELEQPILLAEEYHQQAMELAETAFLEKLHDKQENLSLLRQAFEKERQAAELLASDLTLEPSRSVLHRSAAALAIDCGELRAAEQMLCTGLSGNPPEEIAIEMRDLLKQVWQSRHRGGTTG